jgi:hypothetical protein
MTTTALTDPLAEHATTIRRLGKQTVENIIEIGRRLTEAKRIAGHGRWLKWLDQELGWTAKAAQRFINVYEFSQADIFKYDKLSNLNLPVSPIYLLAEPNTPKEAAAEIIERAKAGEPVPVAEVKRIIEDTKDRAQPLKGGWSRQRWEKYRAKKKPGHKQSEPTTTRNDIGSASTGEMARKDAVIEDLQRQIRVLEFKVAALDKDDELDSAWDRASEQKREKLMARVGLQYVVPAPKPDDGLDIPASLRRAPNGQ